MSTRVLIVDDDPIVGKLIGLCLTEQGHDVRSAATSQEAMEQVDDWQPTCILLDFHLGQENGLDWIEPIHEQLPESPVILITADESDAIAHQARQRGAAFLWRKGQTLPELIGIVNRIHDPARLHGIANPIQ